MADLKNARFYHGDIKPMNVLIDQQNNIKICDFGSGYFFGEEDMKLSEAAIKPRLVNSLFIYSKFYAAPEILETKEI